MPCLGIKWITATGRAELVSEGADDHIDKLSKKYIGEDRYPWRTEIEKRIIIRITPEQVIAYQV